MPVFEITIAGKPMAKQRPRFSGHRTYTPKETTSYENYVKTVFCEKYPDHVPTDQPVKMLITAYYPVAKSWSRKKQEAALAGKIRPAKPDWDNIGKIISDALNEIAYHDDAQVYYCKVIKQYDERPRVEVRITYGGDSE